MASKSKNQRSNPGFGANQRKSVAHHYVVAPSTLPPPFINRPKGCNLFSIWTQLFADIDIQLLSLPVIGLIMCM